MKTPKSFQEFLQRLKREDGSVNMGITNFMLELPPSYHLYEKKYGEMLNPIIAHAATFYLKTDEFDQRHKEEIDEALKGCPDPNWSNWPREYQIAQFILANCNGLHDEYESRFR